MLEKVQRLKVILTNRATHRHGEDDEEEYQRLRAELVAAPSIGTKLPKVVTNHRTLDEFWGFIKPEFGRYAERRKYLRDQFEPLLASLEQPGGADEQQKRGIQVGQNEPDRKTVFVVHGRNEAARKALFEFLRALGLKPLEWGEAVRLTGKGSPYTGEVLDAGFAAAQATVVLMTPDDEARLREPYRHPADGPDETGLTGQPRQNVIFEAGMAMGLHPERTIIVELGKLRSMSDVVGRHAVRLDDTPKARNDLATRLETAKCDVTKAGSDWLHAGNFKEVLAAIENDRASALTAASTSTAPPPRFQGPSIPPKIPALKELVQSERKMLMEMRRASSHDIFESGEVACNGDVVDSLLLAGLAWRGATGLDLTVDGAAVADDLWRNAILQFIARRKRKGMVSGMALLAEEFKFDLSVGTDYRQLLGFLQELNRRGEITGDENRIQIDMMGQQTLDIDGLGKGE